VLKRFFIIMILLAIIAGTFIDPYIFGGTWRNYLIMSLIEMVCFICGICVGMIKRNSENFDKLIKDARMMDDTMEDSLLSLINKEGRKR